MAFARVVSIRMVLCNLLFALIELRMGLWFEYEVFDYYTDVE